MLFEQIVSEGLAHYSYILGDPASGECLVVDPRRDVEIYLEIARANQMRIANILETHIHADYVSGARELAARTGAPLSISAYGVVGFEHTKLEDGDLIPLGTMQLEVLHTPGHTPEHICFLVSGGAGSEAPWALFSGDLLFAGEVGRPDLLGEELEESLVYQLFDTLHSKILDLEEGVAVYPAHGAGSPCGASIGDRPLTTIGYEKKYNPVLQIKDQEDFVRAVREALAPAPVYYRRVKEINTRGPEVVGQLPEIPALSAAEFRDLAEREDAVVIDARELTAYGGGHIQGSLHIGLRSSFPIWAGEILDETFPVWAGQMIDPALQIGLVLPEISRPEQVQLYLFRIGIENTAGYLREGIRTWLEAGYPFVRTEQLSVHELYEQIEEGDAPQIVDVRRRREWEGGHIPGARNIYIADLLERAGDLDPEQPVVTYCGTGYRASIASSLLEKAGFEVKNIPGSMSAWREADFPEEKR
jgi:hydroxyacylglutathione hydrolase